AFDRGPGEHAAECRVVELGEFREAWGGQLGARQEIGLGGGASVFVPRAGREAILAAIDAVAEQRPQLGRDHTLVLDRQVRDAAASIEPVRRWEGLRRAGIETSAA